LKSETL